MTDESDFADSEFLAPKDTEERPYPKQPLYHYTSVDTLTKIVDAESIRATNILYMSDAAELEYGLSVIRDVCDEQLRTLKDQEQEIVEQFRDWLSANRLQAKQIYVCCFTEKPNDINQWRSYTPPKVGVCIGFDGAPIVNRALKNNWKFGNCVYERKNHFLWAEAIISACKRNALRIGPSSTAAPSQKYFPLFEANSERVLQVAARLKHPAFKDEREWRLISPYWENYRTAPIKYRAGESMLVPYTELEISGEPDGLLDILDVTVGPTPHSNLAHQSVSRFLSGIIRRGVTISSRIPYRTW